MGVCFAGAGWWNTWDVPERSKHTLDECESGAWQRRGMPSNPSFESLIKVVLSSLNSAEKLGLTKQRASTQCTSSQTLARNGQPYCIEVIFTCVWLEISGLFAKRKL